jgi:hypothetical protein
MLKWILQNLEIVAIVVLFFAQMIRAFLKNRRPDDERRELAPQDYDEERRVREVQEQVRRQIAARRGEQVPEAPPMLEPAPQSRAPMPRTETTQMPEPFGGPLGRMLEELQRKAQQQSAPPPPPVVIARNNSAELERQQRIADELKSVEDARLVTRRRATQLAASREAIAQSEPALRTDAHDRLLVQLRDVESIRRAIVLREVLGTPVGLR